MTLTLSAAEQARLAATARALLSPLDSASVDSWRARVLARLAGLLEADGAGFLLPVPDGSPYTLHGLPDEFGREYLAADPDRAALEAVRSEGDGVWNTRLLGERLGLAMPDGWFALDSYRSFYARYGIRDGIGFVAFPPSRPTREPAGGADGDVGAAVLTCFKETFGTELFGDRGLAILRLLLPALEAGVAARVRLAGQMLMLERAFDAAGHGIAVHAPDGRRLYANRACTRLLEREEDPERLRRAVEVGVRSVATLTGTGTAAALEDLGVASREVRTAEARYRVRINLLRDEGLFTGGSVILATIERLTPETPTAEALQERWELTPQQSRVALLLAQGESNRAIAGAMGLEPTTTRHYTEKVFRKLGVHSRAEAAAKILTS